MDKHNLMHPPLDVKNLKKKDEVLYILGTKNGKLEIVLLDAQFKFLHNFMDDVLFNDFSNFLGSPVCRNLKAVIFLLIDNDIGHIVNMEIRQMVYEEVRKRKWHIYLLEPKTLSIMSMLFASKIDSKPGDAIMNVLSRGENISFSELRREQEGYSFICDRNINRFNRNVNDVAAEILGTCNHKYVTVCGPKCYDLIMSLKSRVVPSKNVVTIDSKVDRSQYTPKVLKTIFERGCNQITPFCIDTFAVTNESNIIALEQALITVHECEELSLEKVKIVPKSKNPYYVAYFDKTSDSYKSAGKAQESKEKEGHRIKLALVVDRNSLPFLYQEPIIIPEIQALPQKLALSQIDLNVPVIGFYDNSSVICVRDENGYMFLKEWNGVYGNDLYLNLEQEKPIIVTDLQKVKDNDPFVVYDLIKVLSMPANDIKADPNWGFKIISDAENSVSLKVDTFSGSGQKATPVFMMALLLKHHIKAIKNATGKKPKELGFCLLNEFTNEEKKRIQIGLDEACKLLKIVTVVHF